MRAPANFNHYNRHFVTKLTRPWNNYKLCSFLSEEYSADHEEPTYPLVNIFFPFFNLTLYIM